MTTVTLEFSDSVMESLRSSPGDLEMDLRLAAAFSWYEEGRISQEVAAEIAGLDRTDFLLALAKAGRESFKVDIEELKRELADGFSFE